MIPISDELVSRFLTWPVPADVYPDGTPGLPGRTGTNLMTAPQARQMLEHVLQPLTNVKPLQQIVAEIDLRFQSANCIPIEKAMIPASEWHRLVVAINPLMNHTTP